MARQRSSRASLGVALGLVLALAACRVGTTPTSTPITPAPSVASADESPIATSSPAWLILPTPGRPYTADDVLSAMQGSRRPGGVPDELESPQIASAVALQLWTFDGQPWASLTAGGSCGPQRCTLELSGVPVGASAEDLYILNITTSTGEVSVDSAELRGLPASVLEDLGQFARAHWPDAPIPGPLVTGRWLPPPEFGAFVLSYRSGGEERSPALDVRVDVTTGAVDLFSAD